MSTFYVKGSIEEMLPSLEPVLHPLPKEIMVPRFHPEPLKFILQRFSPSIALIDTFLVDQESHGLTRATYLN
jgi:hypothetical protein